MAKTIFVLLTCLIQLAFQSGSVSGRKYVGVVNEYRLISDTALNIRDYELTITSVTAFYNGDIVVFPEDSLTGELDDACLVPDPKEQVIPYKNDAYKPFKAIRAISKAAANNKIYVVVNLYERAPCEEGDSNCPSRGYYIYNTNVAFDRTGMVIARYRKFNVYDEGKVDKPKQVELSTFTTDFGVTFGMFTCFDILFKSPAVDLVKEKNVRDIIFPSRWYGELPFLTSVQIQSGWSYAMNVSMLAAGVSRVDSGSTGTGIYIGREQRINWMSERDGDLIIYHGMPAADMQAKFKSLEERRGLKLLEDPSLSSAESKELDLDAGVFSDEICHNGFCCKFDIKYRKASLIDTDDKYSYRAIVFQGERRFGKNFTHDVAYGAVVLCIDGNCAKKPKNGNFPLIFDEMKIVGQFKKENTLQFPSTLVWNEEENGLLLLNTMEYNQFSYDSNAVDDGDMNEVSIKLTKGNVKKVMTFGIYSRQF